MAFTLGAQSRARLKNVHPDLVRVVERAIGLTPVDFRVLEGVRTLARQKALVAAGASRTLNSRHLTGHAVDLGALLDGKIAWDWPLYSRIAKAMKEAARIEKVPLEWGGEVFGPKFRDGPHFQLPFASYPKSAK